MTEENWSLKTAWNNGHYSLFEHEVFETLRQKLIEDLSEQFPKNQIEIEYLINRRFGIK